MRALNTHVHPLFAGALAAAMAEHFDSAAELVRRARAGGVAAFAELYEAYRSRIYALCLRMTADRSRARLRSSPADEASRSSTCCARPSSIHGGESR